MLPKPFHHSHCRHTLFIALFHLHNLRTFSNTQTAQRAPLQQKHNCGLAIGMEQELNRNQYKIALEETFIEGARCSLKLNSRLIGIHKQERSTKATLSRVLTGVLCGWISPIPLTSLTILTHMLTVHWADTRYISVCFFEDRDGVSLAGDSLQAANGSSVARNGQELALGGTSQGAQIQAVNCAFGQGLPPCYLVGEIW